MIEYEPNACFRYFGKEVSAARREGDANPDQSIIADTNKLFGNCAYSKTIINRDRYRDVKYCTEAVAIQTARQGRGRRVRSRDE